MTTSKFGNQILDRSLKFALHLIQSLPTLPTKTANRVLVQQAIRSGTSIGANAEEAIGANSRKEFVHCMTIARKECRETRYWLRLLLVANPKDLNKLTELGNEATELLKILNSIISTTRKQS